LGLETQSKYNMGTTAVEQSANLRNHLQNNQLDPSQWTQWQTGLQGGQLRKDSTPTDRASIEKAMMDSYNRSAKPQEEAQEASLAARGLSPGSAGYGTYQTGRDDSRAEAARQAYLSSGNESRAAENAYNTSTTQQYNMDQSVSNYYNQLRNAQMQEGFAMRNQPINEITAMMSGSQATIPQFQPFQSSPVQSANIAQYINDNYKAQSAAASQTNAGIFGLAGGLTKMIPG
jgi:hypothetical protein